MSYAKEKQYVRRPDNVFITFIIIYLFFMPARALINPFITVSLQEKALGRKKSAWLWERILWY